jgi:hypothetical protein
MGRTRVSKLALRCDDHNPRDDYARSEQPGNSVSESADPNTVHDDCERNRGRRPSRAKHLDRFGYHYGCLLLFLITTPRYTDERANV